MVKGKLSDLSCGESKTIDRINCQRPTRCRLIDIGFYEGAYVTCLMKSLGGGISAYRSGDTTIAVRREDAENITVF